MAADRNGQTLLGDFARQEPQQRPVQQKMRMHSASSINTFLQCPRKYFYRYILRLPSRPSIHLVRGSLVHEVLDRFFDLSPQEDDEQALTAEIRRLFSEAWQEHLPEIEGLCDEEQQAFYREESARMIDNWLAITLRHIRALAEKKGIAFPEAFSRFRPKRETYYRSAKMPVHGYIDAIHTFDEKVRIIDYKTSKSSEFKDEYKLQLGIYTLLYQEKHGKAPDEVGLFFLKDDAFLIRPDETLVVNALEKINMVRAGTESEDMDLYPQHQSRLCRWDNAWSSGQCDYYEYCFGDRQEELSRLLEEREGP